MSKTTMPSHKKAAPSINANTIEARTGNGATLDSGVDQRKCVAGINTQMIYK